MNPFAFLTTAATTTAACTVPPAAFIIVATGLAIATVIKAMNNADDDNATFADTDD